jgi:hypothetical protein
MVVTRSINAENFKVILISVLLSLVDSIGSALVPSIVHTLGYNPNDIELTSSEKVLFYRQLQYLPPPPPCSYIHGSMMQPDSTVDIKSIEISRVIVLHMAVLL